MGEDVEETAARRLGECLEVAPPDLLGTTTGLPDPPLLYVDRLVAQEVHRADHVVEVVRLQQIRHAILRARHEVGLDAEPQVGVLAHEPAVGLKVVAREFLPQRMLPDGEGVTEAVDVLGDAELFDAPLGGRLAVALGVDRREVLGRHRTHLVRPQVKVVVGQHRGDRRFKQAGPQQACPPGAFPRRAGRAPS